MGASPETFLRVTEGDMGSLRTQARGRIKHESVPHNLVVIMAAASSTFLPQRMFPKGELPQSLSRGLRCGTETLCQTGTLTHVLSHGRKNLVRDKVIDKVDLFGKKYLSQTKFGPTQKASVGMGKHTLQTKMPAVP